jgi:hypothetical protein
MNIISADNYRTSSHLSEVSGLYAKMKPDLISNYQALGGKTQKMRPRWQKVFADLGEIRPVPCW